MLVHCPNCNAEIDSSAKSGLSYCRHCRKNFVFDKNAFKNYHAKWRLNNQDYKAKMLQTVKKYQARHPDRVRDSERKHDHKEKEQLFQIFGRKCPVCGEERERKLIFHQKNGQKHPRSYKYILEHANDFTYICYSCHGHVHWAMEYLHLTWNQMFALTIPLWAY
jgi:Zn-finger nucleic acid-binding protein